MTEKCRKLKRTTKARGNLTEIQSNEFSIYFDNQLFYSSWGKNTLIKIVNKSSVPMEGDE